MQFESLTCNNCGAPLSVPDTANFVTCNHCATRLAIRRTASASTTEKLSELAANQEELLQRVSHLEERQNRQLVNKLAKLETGNELATLERQWRQERKRFAKPSRNGSERMPLDWSPFTGLPPMLFGFWLLSSAVADHDLFSLILGAILMLGGGAVFYFWLNDDYQSERRRYWKRRTQIKRDPTHFQRVVEQVRHIPTPDEFLAELGQQ